MTFPPSYVLVPYSWGEDARLWVVDLTFQRAAEVVAWWQTGGHTAMITILPDASRAVVAAAGPSGSVDLHLIDLRTGAVTLLLAEDGVDLLWPTLDRKGETVAYLRRPRNASAGRADDGIWVTAVHRPAPRHLVQGGAGEARPWGWSPGSDWLAYTQDRFSGPPAPREVRIVSVDGSRGADTGVFGDPVWHPTEARLLITSSATPIHGGTSEVLTYDVGSSASSRVYRSAVSLAWVTQAHYEPVGRRFALLETDSRRAERELLIGDASGSADRVGRLDLAAQEVYWSPTGALLVLFGLSDSVVRLMDFSSGRFVRFCTRSDDPTRCT